MMIIKDIKELEGSCYIEVLPGEVNAGMTGLFFH